MSLLKFTPHMLKNQPDQTAYLLNKLVSEGVGGGEGGKLYPTTGQHTDGAMTQKATTDALGLKADSITVGQQLATKVDKVPGKELSDNNFTDEELAKLNGIEAGAEVNVQSDWDQTDTSADDYIKNKPTIPVVPTNLMTTDTAQTVTGAKTFHNAEIATDNMITLKNNSTSLIRGMAGIEYRQLLKRGSSDVEVGNTHDPLALKGSGTRPKYNSTNLLVDGDLDNVVFHDDPSTVVPVVPYVNTGDIVNGAVTSDKIDWSTIGAGFNRYVTTNQTAAAGTQTTIKLDGSVGTDSGVTYDDSTGVFTIQKAGWWTFAGGIGGAVSAATTVLASISITSGGSTYLFMNRVYHVNTTWGVYIGLSAVFKLSVGDTVMMYIEPTENQMTAINNYTRGHLVGTLICPA